MRAIILVPVLLTACGALSSREAYINTATTSTCNEELRCDDIGEGKDWADMEDCLDGMEDVFDAAWPEGDCDAENFDPTAFDRCVDDAMEAACDGGFIDTIDAFETCRAGKVCTQ